MTVPIEIDSEGNYFITLPDELIAQVGWQIGDTLKWIDQGDGSFLLQKVNEDEM